MPRTKKYLQKGYGGLPPLMTRCMVRERPRVFHPLTPRTDRVLRSHTAKSTFLSWPPANSTRSKRRKRSDPWLPKRKPKAQPRPRRPPPTHFTCRICIEEKPTSDFPQWVTVRSWQKRSPLDAPYQCLHHLARNPRKSTSTPVCKSCIGASMSARLDLLGAQRLYIGCLEPSCTVPWSDSFIAAYLPTHSARAWEKFNLEMFESWKLEHPLMTCVSPTCSASGLPDPHAPGYPQVACHTCAFRSCAQCLVPWHADTTCAEYQAALIDKQLSDPERETLKLMHGKDARRCPICAFVIEKDGGCDSMYCTACHKYFNWQTAASTVLGKERKAPTWAMGILESRGLGSVRCEDEQLRRVQGV